VNRWIRLGAAVTAMIHDRQPAVCLGRCSRPADQGHRLKLSEVHGGWTLFHRARDLGHVPVRMD